MCFHPGFVFPLTEHRQSKFSRIIKGLRIFEKVNEPWVPNLKSPAALAPNNRISQSFEVPKPGIDFSLAMKVVNGTFF